MSARPSSLRQMLLARLLPAMVALLLAGAGMAYWIALGSATKAYDRSLYDIALAVAGRLNVSDGKLHVELAQQARDVLLIDKYDRVFYAVRGVGGENLDGDPSLPMPLPGNWRTLGGEGRTYYDGHVHGQPVRLAALRRDIDGRPITILAGETMVKRNALVREILVGMVVPELLLSFAALGFVWFGVRSSLRPLARLRGELAEKSPADLRPVSEDVPDEIVPVVTEINGLLERLDHSLESQRNFVSDAAHQLRTPIAALQAQVDALIQERADALDDRFDGIVAASRRLAHLVDQMLALARAEPLQQQTGVSLAEVAEAVAEARLPAAISRRIDLGFELAPVAMTGNVLLLEELLANLVDNALRHTPDGGTVTVACGESAAGVWLSVDDSGPGIPAAERERVFERFYRSPASPGSGSGLGLAIVNAIAHQHGGRAVAGKSPSLGGARVVVTFPGPAAPHSDLA